MFEASLSCARSLYGHGVSKNTKDNYPMYQQRGPAILGSPWQVADHKIIKTLQNFICKHTRYLENVQRS